MDFYEGIITTRAIRRYTDDPISEEEIERCLLAAVQAPSGGNVQPYQFVVVRDLALKKAVGEVYCRAHDRHDRWMLANRRPAPTDEEEAKFERMFRAAQHLAHNLHEAQALVLVLMPKIPWGGEDELGKMDIGPLYASVYPAVQNLMLAARSIGIGTVMTTAFRIYEGEVREILGIPDRFELVAMIPMGRPRGRFGVAPRRPPDRITHWDRFGNKRPFSSTMEGKTQAPQAGASPVQKEAPGIAVFAKLVAKEGCGPELLAVIQKAFPAIAAEPGTKVYAMHTADREPDVVRGYEVYVDRAALKAHSIGPTMQATWPQVQELLVEPAEIVVTSLRCAKGLAE